VLEMVLFIFSRSLSLLFVGDSYAIVAHGLWTSEAHTRRRTWAVVHIWAFCCGDFFVTKSLLHDWSSWRATVRPRARGLVCVTPYLLRS
jgi:hypothetical protein